MPISWTLDDYPHFEFVRTPNFVMQGLMNAQGVLQNWIDDFVYMQRIVEWGVLTYTMHPYVIGRGHRMLMLERLILRLSELGAVFLTMEEAAREFSERVVTAPSPSSGGGLGWGWEGGAGEDIPAAPVERHCGR